MVKTMKQLEEQYELEQFFFAEDTRLQLAQMLEAFERPCLLCAPMLGLEVHRKGRTVRVLDIDERFRLMRGFVRWDLRRPHVLDERYDLIVCDPPFFGVSLGQLSAAIRTLSGYDCGQKVLLAYLSRRRKAVERAFRRFNLRATGRPARYDSVEASGRNQIEFYANFAVTGLV